MAASLGDLRHPAVVITAKRPVTKTLRFKVAQVANCMLFKSVTWDRMQ